MTAPAAQKPTDDVIVPPADVEAEAAVISAVMLDVVAIPKVIDFLRPEHFFAESHRWIYQAAIDLFFKKEAVDSVSVGSWLRARDRLRQIGGMSYIMAIADASPVLANVRTHAVAVHDMWRRRSVMLACQRQAIRCAAAVDDVQAFCEDAVASLGKIALQNPVHPVESNDEALARILRETFDVTKPADDKAATQMVGFPTGIYGIDRVFGGLRRSAKMVIAATTGVGKTAMAIQMAVHVAKRGVGVLFFSTELKRHELLRRAASNEAGVNISPQRLRRRPLSEKERDRLIDAAKAIGNLPILIDDTPRITIEEIGGVTRSSKDAMLLKHRVPLGAVFLDYAQRIEPSRFLAAKEAPEQLKHSTKGFKILMQEEDLAGVEMAQAKEQDPKQKNRWPKASTGIADSSQIAKEADDLLFLVPGEPATEKDPRAEVTGWVAKSRAGPKGIAIPMMFRGDLFRFIDPNEPGPSRQYVDQTPTRDDEDLPEPPPGRFDDDNSNPLTDGL